jgi:hypothetical protein
MPSSFADRTKAFNPFGVLYDMLFERPQQPANLMHLVTCRRNPLIPWRRVPQLAPRARR